MKKITILPLAAFLATTFAAQAETTAAASENLTQNFNYISGGFQFTDYSEELANSVSAFNGSVSNSDKAAGIYLRGSWNFADNFFFEMRGDASGKNDMVFSNGLTGLGYFKPMNNELTIYGLAGFSRTTYEIDIPYFFGTYHEDESESGLTAEVGARYQLMEKWTVEPAFRLADYDDSMYELRLGNNIKVSKHMSIEANLMHRDYDGLEEMSYQLGARYSF